MKLKEFEKQLEYNDFAIGDEFWIGGIRFEVINKKRNLPIK